MGLCHTCKIDLGVLLSAASSAFIRRTVDQSTNTRGVNGALGIRSRGTWNVPIGVISLWGPYLDSIARRSCCCLPPLSGRGLPCSPPNRWRPGPRRPRHPLTFWHVQACRECASLHQKWVKNDTSWTVFAGCSALSLGLNWEQPPATGIFQRVAG